MTLAQKIKSMNTPEARELNIKLGKEIVRRIVVGTIVTVGVTLAASAVLAQIDPEMKPVRNA